MVLLDGIATRCFLIPKIRIPSLSLSWRVKAQAFAAFEYSLIMYKGHLHTFLM